MNVPFWEVKMRHFGRSTLALAVLVFWGSTARPADDKMVPEEGAIEVMLLRQKSVQEDLKLTPEETRKLDTFANQQHKKAVAIHGGSSEARDSKYMELSRENERFVAELLEPDQNQRLHQIMLQKAGLLLVTRPKVASALNLSEAQKEKARALQQESRREWVELHHNTKKDARQAKMEEAAMNSRRRLMDLLTDEQEAKFKEMCGRPFSGRFEYHDESDS